jgi:hypothetical protein
MSAIPTYGATVSLNGSAFSAVVECLPPGSKSALGEIDDSRMSDTDGIQRFQPTGRIALGPIKIKANQVVGGCPGIAAASSACGLAAVPFVFTHRGVSISESVLVKEVVPNNFTLGDKVEWEITLQPSRTRS